MTWREELRAAGALGEEMGPSIQVSGLVQAKAGGDSGGDDTVDSKVSISVLCRIEQGV